MSAADDRTPAVVGPRDLVELAATDAARVLGTVLAPLVAQGAIVRRPRAVRWAGRVGADARALRLLDDLAERFERRPVVVRAGRRRMVLPLHHDDAAAVLATPPDVMAPDSPEKRAALRHFQPRAVLVSDPEERPGLRRWNEEGLEAGRTVHSRAGDLVDALDRAAADLARRAVAPGAVTFDDVGEDLWAVGRELVLGPGARDDEGLVHDLQALRSRANWAFVVPVDRARRARLTRALHGHVRAAPPTSLAGWAVARGGSPALAATQVPHWLFAYDAVRIAVWRALAVLAARPEQQEVVRAEADAAASGPRELPHARSAVLESLRLWPTTLTVLRQTRAPTRWGSTLLPPGSGVSLVSTWWHRDPAHRPATDAFAPELWSGTRWTGGSAAEPWTVLPFSAGPVVCPGREVVLLAASSLLSVLVRDARWEPASHPALAHDPLPTTLAHEDVVLGARAHAGPHARGQDAVGSRSRG